MCFANNKSNKVVDTFDSNAVNVKTDFTCKLPYWKQKTKTPFPEANILYNTISFHIPELEMSHEYLLFVTIGQRKLDFTV